MAAYFIDLDIENYHEVENSFRKSCVITTLWEKNLFAGT